MRATASTIAGDWIKIPKRLKKTRMRLICLPQAGGGASSYDKWITPLHAAGIELCAIQYPGREDRVREPPITSCSLMVEMLVEIWPQISADQPCAIFGHSMGALLGWKLAIELERDRDMIPPRHLFISGRNPPHKAVSIPSFDDLNDEDFVWKLIIDGKLTLPLETLAHRKALSAFASILRADYTLVVDSADESAPPCDVPLTVFGGIDDRWTEMSSLAEWESYTRGTFRLRKFLCDHFFPDRMHGEVISSILEDLI